MSTDEMGKIFASFVFADASAVTVNPRNLCDKVTDMISLIWYGDSHKRPGESAGRHIPQSRRNKL